MSDTKELAAILLRGRIGFTQQAKRTLDQLGLKRKHACVVLKDDARTRGMLQKVKDAITWGAIDEETKKELLEKRGKKDADGETKPHVHLNPPKGGFERKGVKTAYTRGGALGNRGEKINDLIKKML